MRSPIGQCKCAYRSLDQQIDSHGLFGEVAIERCSHRSAYRLPSKQYQIKIKLEAVAHYSPLASSSPMLPVGPQCRRGTWRRMMQAICANAPIAGMARLLRVGAPRFGSHQIDRRGHLGDDLTAEPKSRNAAIDEHLEPPLRTSCGSERADGRRPRDHRSTAKAPNLAPAVRNVSRSYRSGEEASERSVRLSWEFPLFGQEFAHAN